MAIDGGDWSSLRPCGFNTGIRVVGTHWISVWVGHILKLEENILPVMRIEPRILGPPARHLIIMLTPLMSIEKCDNLLALVDSCWLLLSNAQKYSVTVVCGCNTRLTDNFALRFVYHFTLCWCKINTEEVQIKTNFACRIKRRCKL